MKNYIKNIFSTSTGKVTETFWISKDYYQLAVEYIENKEDSFSTHSYSSSN